MQISHVRGTVKLDTWEIQKWTKSIVSFAKIYSDTRYMTNSAWYRRLERAAIQTVQGTFAKELHLNEMYFEIQRNRLECSRIRITRLPTFER